MSDGKTTPDESAHDERAHEAAVPAPPAGASSESQADTAEIDRARKRPQATVLDDGGPIEEPKKAVFLGAAAPPAGAGKTHIPEGGLGPISRTLDESDLRPPPPSVVRRPSSASSPWPLILVALIGVGGIVAVVVAKWPSSDASDAKPTRAVSTGARGRASSAPTQAPAPVDPQQNAAPPTDPQDTPSQPESDPTQRHHGHHEPHIQIT